MVISHKDEVVDHLTRLLVETPVILHLPFVILPIPLILRACALAGEECKAAQNQATDANEYLLVHYRDIKSIQLAFYTGCLPRTDTHEIAIQIRTSARADASPYRGAAQERF